MMFNILIITHSPFSKREYDRYGIDVLQQYFDVGVLDCTPWLKNQFWNEYSNIVHKFPGYTAIYDWDGFKELIAGKSRGVAIICFHNITVFQRMSQPLRERGILLAIERLGILPEFNVNIFQKIYSSYKQGVIINQILNKLTKLTRKVYINTDTKSTLSADIAILSGNECLNDPRVQQATHSIWAHSFDYDLYLKHKDGTGERCKPYAVFLDDDIVYSHDYVHIGINPPVTEENYFRELNDFFKIFESNTGYRVIFAAHPNSRYDLKPHVLDGREYVLGRTAELVRDAQIVFCHASTSISFAAMWHKPLVFLTTDELKRTRVGTHIVFFSSLFHALLINMSRMDKLKIDMKVWMRINESDYVDYKERYLKRTGTPDIPAWQIFSDYVRRNLK